MSLQRRLNLTAWLLFLLFSLLAFDGQAQPAVRLVPIVQGLASPLYVTNARDGSNRLFIVEQGGRILVLAPGAATPTLFLDISPAVLAGGEQGLLGLAFHPQFASNGRFFVNYTRQPDGATVIAEYLAAPDPDVTAASAAVLLTIPQPFVNHNGGMIEFGPDGDLYIGMGDGGSAYDPGNRAQNLNELLGKILRIDVDHPADGQRYSSPADNPFVRVGRSEIYALGLRNPYRFSFDRVTGQLWVGDVGQALLEEIDVVTLGGNYGWHVFEGTSCTNLNPEACAEVGFLGPVAQYDHSGGRCSLTGGYVYRGPAGTLPSGTYVFGDYCSGEIFTLQNGAVNVLLASGVNVSSFGEDEAGEIFVVGLGGTVHRLAPAAPSDANVAAASAGAIASASSTYGPGYAVSGLNDGARSGAGWGAGGGWNDATPDAFPDRVQIVFNGRKSIAQVVVYSVQDNYTDPVEPDDGMTFTAYGLTDFTVEGWDGTTWVTLATVIGNNLVKRSVAFSAFVTDRIRITVNNALGSWSRITEVEALGVDAPDASTNVAFAGSGAVASASSTYSADYPVAAVNDGDRSGASWAAGGGWNDASIDEFPDWVEIAFNGQKTIDSVIVYTLQDDYTNPVEPDDSTTFTAYGITDFTVEGWNGSDWVTLGVVSGNNLVKRSVAFAPFTTDRIRVTVGYALYQYSRIVEIEAWGR